jgi:hypothetical protein
MTHLPKHYPHFWLDSYDCHPRILTQAHTHIHTCITQRWLTFLNMLLTFDLAPALAIMWLGSSPSIYTSMYICVYMCMYYRCAYTHTCLAAVPASTWVYVCYVCVCICVCMCMYHICAYTHVCLHNVAWQQSQHLHEYVYMCVCMYYTCAYTHICLHYVAWRRYVCILCVCMYAYICIYIYIYMLELCGLEELCIHVCMYIIYIYVYIHTHMLAIMSLRGVTASVWARMYVCY